MNVKRILIFLGSTLAATTLLAAPLLETRLERNETVFNDATTVTKTAKNFPAKAVSYTLNTAEAATNALTITVTRIKTLVDRDAAGPNVTTWTNTHVIATINTTNAAGAIDTGSITDTFYTEKDDSIAYANDVVTNGILTIQWEY